jgi:hypothetical protein
VKRRFLVVYDYGQGGVWAFLNARSKSEIQARFPQLQVVPEAPLWMSKQELGRLERTMTYDIDDEPEDFLALMSKSDVSRPQHRRASG